MSLKEIFSDFYKKGPRALIIKILIANMAFFGSLVLIFLNIESLKELTSLILTVLVWLMLNLFILSTIFSETAYRNPKNTKDILDLAHFTNVTNVFIIISIMWLEMAKSANMWYADSSLFPWWMYIVLGIYKFIILFFLLNVTYGIVFVIIRSTKLLISQIFVKE